MHNCQPISWSTADIETALDLLPDKIRPEIQFTCVSTDSRAIQNDELFVALRGESFDGHDFIHSLVDQGIKGIITEVGFVNSLSVSEEQAIHRAGAILFPVPDTLKALAGLARFQRDRSNVKVVAITGSNGKTSTREITAGIFKERFVTLTTQGNFNNEIGLPLTLLKLSHDHQWAVVEMGMNHPGEISRLGAMAKPDIGIITNTATAHLEGLKTVENVARAKAELMGTIGPGGSAILNIDDGRVSILTDQARKNSNISRIIYFGRSHDAQVRAKGITQYQGGLAYTLCHTGEKEQAFFINSPAPFMVTNSLAATAAALQAGIDMDEIKQGVANFNPVSGRMNIFRTSRGIHLINDTYNANPGSVRGALETLAILSKGRKSFAVLGDMLELGEASEMLHRGIGETAAQSGIDMILAFGPTAEEVIKGAVAAGMKKADTFIGSKGEIAGMIDQNAEPGSWVLVKGSRGMRMEEVVELLNHSDTGSGTRAGGR